jgi:hypothetical protein
MIFFFLFSSIDSRNTSVLNASYCNNVIRYQITVDLVKKLFHSVNFSSVKGNNYEDIVEGCKFVYFTITTVSRTIYIN